MRPEAELTEAQRTRRRYNSDSYFKNKPARIAAAAQWKIEHPTQAKASYSRFWEKNRTKEKREQRRAFFEASPKEAWWHFTYHAAKTRARKKGVPVDRIKPAIDLPDHCPVLGIELRYKAPGKCGPTPNSPSVDRKVPALGYVAGNMRIISNRANMIKNNASVEEVQKVLEYMKTCAL